MRVCVCMCYLINTIYTIYMYNGLPIIFFCSHNQLIFMSVHLYPYIYYILYEINSISSVLNVSHDQCLCVALPKVFHVILFGSFAPFIFLPHHSLSLFWRVLLLILFSLNWIIDWGREMDRKQEFNNKKRDNCTKHMVGLSIERDDDRNA